MRVVGFAVLVVMLLGSLVLNGLLIRKELYSSEPLTTRLARERRCVENSIPSGLKEEAIALGFGWLERSLYCDFGTYQFLVSPDPTSDSFSLLKGNKPFIAYEKGLGINLFQEYTKGNNVPYLVVQDWDESGIFRRLDYMLVDDTGQIIGSVRDESMNGETKITKFSVSR